MMKLKPLADRVVLVQSKAEEKTQSGIFLAASAQEKPEIYEVIEVGPGGMVDGKEVTMQVKEGQKVVYSKYAGTEIKIDGEKVLVGKYSGSKIKLDESEYTIVRQSDILAIVE